MAKKKVTTSPKGTVSIEIDGETYKLRLGSFGEVADADEHLGKSLVGAILSDPLNFHYLRTAFYFGTRELNDGIRTVKQAGQLLSAADPKEVSKAIFDAFRASGVLGDADEATEEAEGEA